MVCLVIKRHWGATNDKCIAAHDCSARAYGTSSVPYKTQHIEKRKEKKTLFTQPVRTTLAGFSFSPSSSSSASSLLPLPLLLLLSSSLLASPSLSLPLLVP